MHKLIHQFFIKSADEKKQRQILGTVYGTLGIILNLFLFLLKYDAGKASGSVAVVADGLNNLSDAAASAIALAGFRLAAMKRCKRFPFGFGRIEYLSSLFISSGIVFVGMRMLFLAAEKIFHPQAVRSSPCVVTVLVVSIAVKFYLFRSNKRIGTQIDSAGMKANSVNSLSDCIATAAILFSMGLSRLLNVDTDGIGGAMVAFFILYAGITSALEAFSALLGESPDAETTDRIWDTALSHDGILGVRTLSLHDYGPTFRFLFLELDSSIVDREKAQAVCRKIEQELTQGSMRRMIIKVNFSESKNNFSQTGEK